MFIRFRYDGKIVWWPSEGDAFGNTTEMFVTDQYITGSRESATKAFRAALSVALLPASSILAGSSS